MTEPDTTQSTINIRRVERADLDRLVDLCGEHAAFEKADFEPAGKAVALEAMVCGPDPRLIVWVVDSGEGAIGYASFSREASTWQACEYLHLDCLYLRPEARNLGLGRDLLQKMVDAARESGIREIQWQTPSWNRDAIRFYERLGAASTEKLRFTWFFEDWFFEDGSFED